MRSPRSLRRGMLASIFFIVVESSVHKKRLTQLAEDLLEFTATNMPRHHIHIPNQQM